MGVHSLRFAYSIRRWKDRKSNYSGQLCNKTGRVIAQDGIYDEFVSLLADDVKKYGVGDPMNEDNRIGCLYNSEVVSNFLSLVDDAVSKGAKIVCGGKRHALGGTFVEPTVLADVNPSMRVFSEEIIGPLVPVYKFQTNEDAVELLRNLVKDSGFYYHQAMKYGSIVCRTTMLLILIKLKEAYPDVIESFMKDEVSILQSPVLLPKERELLLRLLISYLPPSAVLSVIQNSSPSSSASIIHSLCHLPVDVLLEEYLSVESGLLNTDDSLVVDSIVDLLIAIARHSSHFQRIQLIQILFKRMHKSKKNTAAFLQCVSSLLENTYYITSSSEQELLVQFAQEEALREPSLRVLSLCVLPTMSDVKSVGEATHTTQLQWVGQSLLCSS
ncbi:hypothetical protein AV274_1105 [Blastocystis sp. ATCC 50177/Nand II]|uniref:Aldehyde dehydrogenase domain-containing protein n=1 Tax=Blastocystis sp. subtype 1 (strain ATCC 50177 / NandII) TaxID=478820 RepID=A0A196SLL0_BLAHN|nr:hypothetical protein AV274_1105 [Blastocystis sp. ATCC 50177/Nand II]